MQLSTACGLKIRLSIKEEQASYEERLKLKEVAQAISAGKVKILNSC